MNANKSEVKGAFLLFMVAAMVAPVSVQAQSYAPAMYGVGEIQIQHGRLGNQKVSTNCGLSSSDIGDMLLKAMQTEGLPAFSVLNAPPPQTTVARVDAFPDIITIQPRDKECISWVALTVQSREPLQINPIKTPRNLVTTYWTGGLMVGSSNPAHAASINDALMKLVAEFGRQYRVDQPPDLTKPRDEPSLLDKMAPKP